MNEPQTVAKYAPDRTKIVFSSARNLAVVSAALVFVGLTPQIWLKSVLIIITFPFILCASVFVSKWLLQIADVLIFWIKEIDFEAKTINKKIKYEDFYLLEYNYSFSNRFRYRVFALLFINAAKKSNFRTLCVSDESDKLPEECREFIKRCQEERKHLRLGGKRSIYRFKIGRQTYLNWSFLQRIFVQHVAWTALMLLLIPVCFYLVLPGEEAFFARKGFSADKITRLKSMPAGFVKKLPRR